MKLARDIIDKQLVDKNQTKMGKVDGLVLTLESGKQPVVSSLEIGSITLARRIGKRAERLVRRLKRRLGAPRSQEPYRVPWRKVKDIGVDIELALDVRETPVFDWQDWLRRKVIKRFPGS
jgi:sporulation protein YlmC with PRC-barrel domain